MLEKVLVFMPPYSQYGVLHDFTRELAAALSRQGTEVKIIEGRVSNPQDLLSEIFQNPPDCTLSFNGLLPDQEGRFFCDLVQVPHVACLVDSPNHFFPLIKSPYTIITCVDRYFCNFFSHSKSSQVLFMPHAVSKNIHVPPEKPRKYDIVMLSTCIDPEISRIRWQEKYPGRMSGIIDAAAEITLFEQDISFIEAFSRALNEDMQANGLIDLATIDYEGIFDLLEDYVKGVDRLELVRAIQQDHQLHLFGAGIEACWSKFFPSKKSNVIFHDSIPYEAALEVMQDSKVILNSCANIRNGAHERIFTGMASGALVCTNGNVFMRENFTDGQEIVYYQTGKWGDVNQKLKHYLDHEAERCELVNKGYVKVKNEHTWDNRAKMLVDFIPAMLSQIEK